MSADGTIPNRNNDRIRYLEEHEVSISPPSRTLLALETRAWAEFASFILSYPLLRRLPRGDGHPVFVIPGFGASDISTIPMRRLLRRLGYDVHGWRQGRNLGMRPEIRAGLESRITRIAQRERRSISIIGWSLGGVYAREIARLRPDLVRRVITLGSPINGHYFANNVVTLFNLLNRNEGVTINWKEFQERRVPPPVPSTAIYSRSDGIVSWECCREEAAPNTENVEVVSSHFGLGVNPLALAVVADRLAQPEGSLRRFRPSDWQHVLSYELVRSAA